MLKAFHTTFACSIAALLAAACSGPSTPAGTAETGAPQPPAETAEADEGGHSTVLLPEMSCGPNAFITPASTREKLIADHGAESITEETVAWVESEETATVLFAADPSMRAELFWFGQTAGGPSHARVGGDDTQWIGPQGVIMGATLEQVEAANGGPFMLMGFENHNSGEAGDWLGGALATPEGGKCFQRVAFAPGDDADPAALSKLGGDPEKRYRSDSPEMRAAKPVVIEMAVTFAQE